MFKFSIREWLLAMVIVGMAMGWAVRERRLRAELDSANAWRGRAGALEFALRKSGRPVTWNFKKSLVFVFSGDPSRNWAGIPTTYHEPSPSTDSDWP